MRYWPGQKVKLGCEICTCVRGRPQDCQPNPECAGQSSQLSSHCKQTWKLEDLVLLYCVCLYVCVCTFVFLCVCGCVCVHAVFMCVCVCVYVFVFVCFSMCLCECCVCVCLCVCSCVCMRVYYIVHCGWTAWSPWGECLGPCGVQSVQWSFRSPNNPSTHGSGRQCRGIYRKARR